MERRFTIYSSDQINRQNQIICVSALEGSIWENATKGIPTHLGHDMHRLIGWAIPFALYFEPKITYSVGYTYFPESEEEGKNIAHRRDKSILNNHIELIEKHKEAFKKELEKFYIDGEGEFFYPSCVSYVKTGILYEVFPDLNMYGKEKNGLIYLNQLLEHFQYIGQGIFKHKKSDKAVFVHKYFRRSFSEYNNYRFMFLDELISLKNNSDIQVRIALDEDMIGFSPSYLGSIEHDFWFGPKYNDDIASITPGLTRHQSNEIDLMYSQILFSDIFWKSNEQLHEFEFEEVRNEPIPTMKDVGIYGCRYMHAIYDKKKKEFNHFDGAVRSYSTDLMVERIEAKMTEFGRRSEYKKLFRIDGKLSISKWKSLATNYMQDNPHIHEYFGSQRPAQNGEQAAEITVKEKLFPYAIGRGDGIRMLLSYHEKSENISSEREVLIFDRLNTEDGEEPAVEYCAIELKKVLGSLNGSLFIPESTHLILVEDLCYNFPCIFHNDNNTIELVNKTLEAFRKISVVMKDCNGDRIISFTLAWNIEDQQVRLSFFGNAYDIDLWLKSFDTIPVDREGLRKWIDIQKKYLSNFQRNKKSPRMDQIINPTGVLYIRRRVSSEDFDIISMDNEEGKATFKLQFHKGKEDLLIALEANEIVLIPVNEAVKVRCSLGCEDYKMCPHSIYIDGNHTIVEDFKLVQFYWAEI